MSWVESAAGALLVGITLLDIFLTVLYARLHTGIISTRLTRVSWRAFRVVARALGRRETAALSFGGPIILVTVVLTWAFLLTLGAGLIIHPALGDAVRSSSGVTAGDFITALYVGGSSMSIVGTSDYGPMTFGYELIFLFNSLVGLSVISLTLTYLMQVYTALRDRNSVALDVHLQSAGTGDAAELVAHWGPRGQFAGGYTNLSALATEMTRVNETHHFYPVLFYFRFQEPEYSVSRMTLVSLDAIALMRSGLDENTYGWLLESAGMSQLGRACTILVRSLEDAFLSTETGPEVPDPRDQARWRERYQRGLRRLRAAGLALRHNTNQGADRYVELRAEWDADIRRLAPAMAYSLEQVDPALSPSATRP